MHPCLSWAPTVEDCVVDQGWAFSVLCGMNAICNTAQEWHIACTMQVISCADTTPSIQIMDRPKLTGHSW